MRDYELLYIVAGDKTEAEATAVTDEVNAFLAKQGGKASDEDVQGRKRLAYEIDKQDHGWYIVTRFAIEPAKVGNLQTNLNLNSHVTRAMIVSADELPSDEDKAKVAEASERRDEEREKPRAAAAKPIAKPETVATKPAKIEKTEEAAEKPAKPKKPETAAEKKERQAKLDEKLGEILKDEE